MAFHRRNCFLRSYSQSVSKKHGYTQSIITSEVLTHKWRPICFPLVVDNFSVTYVGQEDANHLIKVMKENNNLGEDPEGSNYIGISLNWDISKGKAHLSRPGYVEEALQ